MLRLPLTILTLLLPTVAAAAPATVTVERKAPVTRTRTFDPNSPPPEARIGDNEQATTKRVFKISAGVAYQVVSQGAAAGGQWSATIRIDSVKVELGLETTIFLPKDARDKLVAHEQGHREISEAVYQADAETTARRLAAPLVGQTFTATGPDPDTAASNASKVALQRLNDDYMAAVGSRASEVNVMYDKLTDHGRNQVSEADAIQEAFKNVDKAAKSVEGGRASADAPR